MATYLWENYIEINEATHIYLLGIGAAYTGVVWLLGNEERCQDRVDEVIAFVAESSIIGVSRPADDGVSTWYYQHSTIFVATNHYFWNPDRPKKQRKRYGTLKQSPHSDLNDMLRHHMPEVQATLKHGMEEWHEEVAREEEERLRRESAMREASQHQHHLQQQQHQQQPPPPPPHHFGAAAAKPAPMMLDGGPMSPVRGHISSGPTSPVGAHTSPRPVSPSRAYMPAVPVKSPGNKVPPIGMFTVTSSPGRPRSVDSPASGSPSRR